MLKDREWEATHGPLTKAQLEGKQSLTSIKSDGTDKKKENPGAMIAPVGTADMPVNDVDAKNEVFDKSSCEARAKSG